MSDALIDPYTRGYLLASGSATRDPAAGLGNAVYLRLMTPLGSYWADASLGSRLHELQREKDLPRVSVLAKQYAEDALAPLIVDGRATQITVTTAQPGNGWLMLLVQVVAASGEKHDFSYPVKVI
ncbi:phage GP46 family protein [uncultured Aquitalea sp.]|uniref:phage GP46 family protein n=1 Tax=uncultured Aquitalea sp. TaxID=540272 RepID=UPI0025D69CB5|nr:phage GP46 family protein [uncultured Aquitalea sp.]